MLTVFVLTTISSNCSRSSCTSGRVTVLLAMLWPVLVWAMMTLRMILMLVQFMLLLVNDLLLSIQWSLPLMVAVAVASQQSRGNWIAACRSQGCGRCVAITSGTSSCKITFWYLLKDYPINNYLPPLTPLNTFSVLLSVFSSQVFKYKR